ncbi:MAG TPA: glycosyltransferase family 1 protein [Candidatus Moranbacteria bacterium]|nr:glycosyltransferase family 1 protein [Candidatus Moranbacteria bacterium]
MKLILIKFGKAWMTIRKNGILKGGQRILEYLFIFLKLLFGAKKGDVLFITGGVGDSAHYRSHNVAEELKKHNFKCSVMIQDNPFLYRYANNFKVFIFQKTISTPTLQRLIDEIKKQKKEIIFETDDLIFDEKYLHQMDYWKQMDKFTKQQYEGGQGSELLKDNYVKTCTTTTTFLKNKLEQYNKKVFLVPNRICDEELKIANKLYSNLQPTTYNLKTIKIGYFSGTISHNKDFATITDTLINIMDKYKQVKLVLVGPLDIENKLNKYSDRIEQLPMVSRRKHYANIASVDINISPLEIDNEFCQAKSALKFFEAGIVGVPTVATATQSFQDAILDGRNGLVASNEKEWFEKLERLITDNEFRAKMGAEARKTVLKKYTIKNSNNKEYYNYLRKLI